APGLQLVLLDVRVLELPALVLGVLRDRNELRRRPERDPVHRPEVRERRPPRLVPEQAKTQRTSGIGCSVNLRDTPFMPPIGTRPADHALGRLGRAAGW